MTYIIGVDPGINGAIAILDNENEKFIEVYDMPCVSKIVNKRPRKFVDSNAVSDIFYIHDLRECAFVLIEDVSARPSQGVVSMFGFGRSLGVIEGVTSGHQIDYCMVKPKEWIKRSCKNAGKDGSRKLAAELYPEHADKFARVKDDGRAEAVLIARFGGDFFND